MEVGIKFYSHNVVEMNDFEFSDFVEVLPVPENPLGVFKQHRFRYRIHCAHDAFGFNPSDPASHSKSLQILRQAIHAADQLKADRIVVHAGYNNHSLRINEPAANALRFLADNFDKRICIENLLPIDEGKEWVVFSPEHIASYKDRGFKFCLDFGHAVATAAHLKKDYKEYVLEFVRLKPDYFHLSGTLKGEDRHMSIFEADTDMEFFKEIIKRHGKPVCLETPLNAVQRKKEIAFLRA